MTNLSATDGLVECPEDVEQRCFRIGLVEVVDVDEIGRQAPEASIQLCADGGGAYAFVLGSFADVHAHLGGQHDAVAASLQGLAQDLLGHPAGGTYHPGVTLVHVGGIDEIDPVVDRPAREAYCVRLLYRRAEGHCAQAYGRHAQISQGNLAFVHDVISCRLEV